MSLAMSAQERDRRFLAHRYLGPELGDRYLEETAGEDTEENVTVRVQVERWLSADYGKQFQSP